ncbi:MAG: hypothetical protein HOP12_03900, partial [Candidatus Eisenbacteria bacterium]|nr:hypothetical protein [Candidatus Eisenbacteria bacterium]
MPIDERNSSPTPEHAGLTVDGEAIVYRLYDLGYGIDLERASELLGASGAERVRPVRGEGLAIQISNPPLTIAIGTESLPIGSATRSIELSARIFDFGVLSLRARIVAPSRLTWSEFARFGDAVSAAPGWREFFTTARDRLMKRMLAAISKPGEAPVTEDYTVFRVNALQGADGVALTADALREQDIAQLLLGESRPISSATRRELLSQRFTYYEDDLAVLTWNSALVVEPTAEDTDVQYVLEFANAQLLELRYYDALLDRELPEIYDRIEEARNGFHLIGRRYGRLLGELQKRFADATELVERVENSLKVTDDVYLARIYAAALEIFRGPTWRSGVDHKLSIVRDAYTMLNAESQARRSEALEVIIVLLILFEIVLAWFRP